jgi:hypothetical protein
MLRHMRYRGTVASVSLVVCLALTSFRAEAFSVTNHALITEAATRFIRSCIYADPERWATLDTIDDHTGTLIACNLHQDDLARKSILWHFYGRGELIKGTVPQGEWISVEDSFDSYYRMVVGQLKDAATKGMAVGSVGALLHYVQDVCVPAHVIPIYHPKPLWNGDAFDGFPFQATAMTSDPPTCERLLSSSSDTFETLLQETAGRTMAAIEEKIPDKDLTVRGAVKDGKKGWHFFWNTKRDKGLGSYACGDNNFGNVGFDCDHASISVNPDAYVAFALKQQLTAVEATVRALLVAHRQGLFSDQATGALACPVAGAESDGKLRVERQELTGPRSLKQAGELKRLLWIALRPKMKVAVSAIVTIAIVLIAIRWRRKTARRRVT